MIHDIVPFVEMQIKEMGGRSRPAESLKTNEQSTEKKKGFDWMNLMKPGNEEKDHWVTLDITDNFWTVFYKHRLVLDTSFYL